MTTRVLPSQQLRTMISNIIELFFAMIVKAFFIPLFRIQDAVLWLGLVELLALFVVACIGAAPLAIVYYSRGGQSVAAQGSTSTRRRGKALVRGLYLDAPSHEDACTHQREVSERSASTVTEALIVSDTPGQAFG